MERHPLELQGSRGDSSDWCFHGVFWSRVSSRKSDLSTRQSSPRDARSRAAPAWPLGRWLLPIWLAGFVPLAVGLFDLIPEWDFWVISVELVIWLIAPVLVIAWPGRTQCEVSDEPARDSGIRRHVTSLRLALLCAVAAFAMVSWSGWRDRQLPPAYHDEYSYLFQAEIFRGLRWSVPSPERYPELFNQMHVLNEGRMASRYLPGTGAVILPGLVPGLPQLGHWCCMALSALLAYATAHELSGRVAGLTAGLTFAVAPATIVFGNLLLAHAPTLAALAVFVFFTMRWLRTGRAVDAMLASFGLAAAILCRPATAFGCAIPFVIAVAWMLLRSARERRLRWLGIAVLAWSIPLLTGFSILFSYNRDITGSGWTMTYQYYTDIYTPRHVYGFDNVVRGEQHLGPKVNDLYDRWAVNLTPQLAIENTITRLLGSWLWTWDPLVLFVTAIAAPIVHATTSADRRWWLILGAIAGLHGVHFAYWYTGIFGWHYVYETSWLWLLLLGLVTQSTMASGIGSRGYPAALIWLTTIVVAGIGATCVIPGFSDIPRTWRAWDSVRFARQRHAEFFAWTKSAATPPALVLVRPTDEELYMSYVTNRPGLEDPVIYARELPNVATPAEVARAFPNRNVYVCDPAKRTLREVSESTR